jgi:hypothetical protein
MIFRAAGLNLLTGLWLTRTNLRPSILNGLSWPLVRSNRLPWASLIVVHRRWSSRADVGLASLPGMIFGTTGLIGLSGPVSGGRCRSCDSTISGERMCGNGHCRTAAILRVKLRAVFRSLTLLLDLGSHHGCSRSTHCGDLGWTRTNCNATTASVIGDPTDVVHDNGAVVYVGDPSYVDAVYRTVVVEVVAVPVAAVKAVACIAEAVINAAVEADVQTPVTVMEAVMSAVPTPVTGRPESAGVGSKHPCSGNPVVSSGSPVPVTGSPEVVRRRGFGLVIFR